MIVRTPRGTFLVRPEGQGGAMGQGGGPDAAAMDDQAPSPPPPPPAAMPPRPRPPHPPMMQTKAARFRIKMGDMEIGVTCGEDEPIKNCVDAVGALVDKIASAQHH